MFRGIILCHITKLMKSSIGECFLNTLQSKSILALNILPIFVNTQLNLISHDGYRR